LDPLGPFESLLVDLGKSLPDLFLIMRGNSHGIFQGTHEAASFEARGGQIGPGGFNHLDSLRQTAAAIETRQDALNRLQGLDGALGSRLKQLCDPVLRQSGRYLRAAADTESAAVSLRSTDPTRFEGVIVGEGGLANPAALSGGYAELQIAQAASTSAVVAKRNAYGCMGVTHL
jgi:hypothetical protein